MSDPEKVPAGPTSPHGGGIAGGISPRRPTADQPPIEEALTPRERRRLERRREHLERREERRRAKGR
ncbi:MAG: hypothetical protein ACRDIY_15035 [Chloroflexota bacterium]